MQKHNYPVIALIVALSVSPVALARSPQVDTVCDIAMSAPGHAREVELLICGNGLPEEISVSTGDELELIYLQKLRRCDMHDRRPGFHSIFSIAPGTKQARIAAKDVRDSAELCSYDLEVPANPPPPEPPWVNAMPEESAKFIDVDGIRTRYFEQGSGRPLLLVHGGQAGGSNNSAEKWEQNLSGLAEYFRVIAIDRLAQAKTANLFATEDYAEYFAGIHQGA